MVEFPRGGPRRRRCLLVALVLALMTSTLMGGTAAAAPTDDDWGKLPGNPARPMKAIYFFPGNARQATLPIFTQTSLDQQVDFYWSDNLDARTSTVSRMRAVGANTVFEVYKGYNDCGPNFMDYTVNAFMALWDELDKQSSEPTMKIVPSMEDIHDIELADRTCPSRFNVADALNPVSLENATAHVVGLVKLIQSRRKMAHWAQLLDSTGTPRYAINLTGAGSKHISPLRDDQFIRALDGLASAVEAETKVKVGFTLDPMVRGPREGDMGYSLTRRDGENVQVADLRGSRSLLAIVPFLSELDGMAAFCSPRAEIRRMVECNAFPDEYRAVMRYKKNFIKAWAASGVPTFLDLDRGYDGHLVFNPAASEEPTKGVIIGNQSGPAMGWLNMQSEIKGRQGDGNRAIVGVIYNSWNGFTEGMAAVPTSRPAWNEKGTNQDLAPAAPGPGVLLPVPKPHTREDCGRWCARYDFGDADLRWLTDMFSVDPGLCDHYYYDLRPGPDRRLRPQPVFHVFGSICEKFTQHYGQIGVLGAPAGDARDAEVPGWVVQEFANGRVYWSGDTGAHEVHGGIYAHYRTLGGERGPLGPPLTDETGTPDGRGRFNAFQNGSIYWTEKTLGRGIWGGVRDEWARLGYERGPLGYPTSDTRVTGALCSNSTSNTFEHGEIEWCPSDGRVQVKRY